MELSVVKPGNKAAGTVAVSEANFAREYNEALVHQVVTAFLSGARQGTRAQKTRSEVAGGGKKEEEEYIVDSAVSFETIRGTYPSEHIAA